MPRILLIFALLLAACTGGKLQGTVARVRVPEAVNLPKTYVGETSRTPFIVEAIGQSPVQIHSVDSRSSVLSIDGGAPQSIPGGTSITVTIAWSPVAAGALEAELVVATDVEGAEELHVPIRGVSEEKPDCDDANACTDDTFDRATGGCLHAPHARACDDGNACTADDRCHDGTCLGVARTCDDGDTCTLDLCDPTQGCLFPPDGRQCDDGDPCTKDVCDREKGCSHPNADDGTSCGAFSCATANLCVLGACRELDVSGLSDGFPCFDGDLCTDGDQCSSGTCVGGPYLPGGPQVVGSIETFGVEGDGLASDGFRYVFTDSRTTRIATLDASGQLVVRARLPVGSKLPPLTYAPGQFVLAADDRLAMFDATDPEHPQMLWTWNIPPLPSSTQPRPILQLATSTAGLLVVAGTTPNGPDQLLLVRIPHATRGPTEVEVLYEDAFLGSLATQGSEAVVSGSSMVFFVLDAAGEPIQVVPLASNTGPNRHVGVNGRQVAYADVGRIEMDELAPAALAPVPCGGAESCRYLAGECESSLTFAAGSYRTCGSGSDCPAGSMCRRATANVCLGCDDHPDCVDVGVCVTSSPQGGGAWTQEILDTPTSLVFTTTAIYLASDAGIVAFVPDARPTHFATGSVDALDHARLALGGDDTLLAMGALAVPLKLSPGVQSRIPLAKRLTGHGLGGVTRIVPAGGPLALTASRGAVGIVDLQSQNILQWSIPDDLSTPAHPRVIVGPTSAAVVEDAASSVPSRSGTCFGAMPDVFDVRLQHRREPVCGLEMAHLATSGTTLVADANAEPGGDWVEYPRRLASWNLSPVDPTPQVSPGDGVARADTIRTLPDGRILRLGFVDVATIQVAVHAPPPSFAQTEVARLPVAAPAGVRASQVAMDGKALLAASGQDVKLFRIDGGATSVMGFTNVVEPVDTTIPAMSGGRAWSWSRRVADDTGTLTELTYDREATSLLTLGSIELSEPISSVTDVGPVTVVTANHEVLLVRPSCH